MTTDEEYRSPLDMLCPVCGGAIPSDDAPGAYPGALSRWDNKTEICSACGVIEAFRQMCGESLDPSIYWLTPMRAVDPEREKET